MKASLVGFHSEKKRKLLAVSSLWANFSCFRKFQKVQS